MADENKSRSTETVAAAAAAAQVASIAQLQEIEGMCTTFEWAPGATILGEGGAPGVVFIVRGGRVTMLRRAEAANGSGDKGPLEPVMSLGDGEYFGQHARAATGGAVKQCVTDRSILSPVSPGRGDGGLTRCLASRIASVRERAPLAWTARRVGRLPPSLRSWVPPRATRVAATA
jgi:hypothetical protein